MAEDAKKKMHRSPNHPFFDLKEAVEKIGAVYEKERLSPTAPLVVVKHLGYSALNGPGGRTISGLRQFGLLEESGGRVKVSEDAYSILRFGPESEQRKSALRRAALKPALYRELYGQFPDLTASDDTLHNELHGRGFNPDVIEHAISNFRSTMTFAGLPDGSYTDPEGGNKMQTLAAQPPTHPLPRIEPQPGSGPVKTFAYMFGTDGTATLTIVPPYTEEDIDDLEENLKIGLKALRRSLKKESQA